MDFGLTLPRSSPATKTVRSTGGPIDLLPPEPLADVRLIAEPWDAEGAYQLGRSFPAKCCFQWNGRFRDDIRRFVRGDPGIVPALMQRLYGSDDLFPDDRPHAFASRSRASTTSRATTASPFTTLCRTTGNVTMQTATTTRMARRKTTVGTAAGKETKEPRRACWSCESDRRRTSAACSCWRTARRCSARATSSCRRRAATTTRTTKTIRQAGSIGTGSASTRMYFGSSAR